MAKTISRPPVYAALAPQVMAMRLFTLWRDAAMAPKAMEREAALMVTEKIMASQDAMIAANLQIWSESQKLWFAAMTGSLTIHRIEASGRRVVSAAEKPISKSVSANNRRLKKGLTRKPNR